MHSTGHDGVALQIRARVIAEGGMVTSAEQAIEVRDANAAIVLVAIGTGFHAANPEQLCMQALEGAAGKTFAQILRTHIADYQPLYRRTAINLGETPFEMRQQPTDIRRKALENGAADPELLALFFQYGRYLTISGSRADSPLPSHCKASGTMVWRAAWHGRTTFILTLIHSKTTGRPRCAISQSVRCRFST
jgi:alpha-L-fucosidase 2